MDVTPTPNAAPTRATRAPARSWIDWANLAAWFVFPIAGMLWVGTWYRNSYPYFDEWTTITKSLRGWTAAFDGHQGHLEVPSYLLYRLQRGLFGFEGHQVVYGAFLASLAAMQLSIAAVLRRLGLPTVIALLAATVVTFSGPGAQGMTWEFMVGINLALALSFFAGFLALGERRDPPVAIAIAALLVVASLADSGVAAFGAVFVAILLVFLWPWRLWLVALVPPAIVQGLWFLFGDLGPTYTTNRAKTWTFAWRLFAVSAGGLVGGGETPSRVGGAPAQGTIPVSGAKVGLVVLAVAGGCIIFGFVRRRLDRKVTVNLAAGLAAAAVMVVVLARTRAFLIVPAQFPGSRYVQWVGAFLMVGLAPALTAALRPAAEHSRRLLTYAAGVGLVVVFAVNLVPLDAARDFQDSWSAGVEQAVRETVTVSTRGCGPGRRVDPHAMPTTLSPQIDVALVRELLADGSLTPAFGLEPSAATLSVVCVDANQPPSAGTDQSLSPAQGDAG